MNTKYESPLMVIEMFAANQTIATSSCTEQTVKFDCMRGSDTDYTYVITDDCSWQATEFDNIRTAIHAAGSTTHSNGTGGSWNPSGSSSNRPSNVNLTYTARADAYGLLCICVNDQSKNNIIWTNSEWELNTSETAAVHDSTHTGAGWHCQVAPLIADPTAAS